MKAMERSSPVSGIGYRDGTNVQDPRFSMMGYDTPTKKT